MKLRSMLIVFTVACITNIMGQETGHGDVKHRAKNVHAGNLVRVTFHNNGRLGSIKGDQSVVYTGEWPIGTGKVQMGNTSAYVMSELRISKGINSTTGLEEFEFVTPAIFCEGWDPDIFSHDALGRFQGFEPLPGYFNLTQKEKDPGHAIAMSHQAFTWPPYWPDKLTDNLDSGWRGHWNGYFGKDQQNADEESYYVMDDYQFDKRIKGLELPKPDSLDLSRSGLGLRMSVRGLQWSNPDAEDVIFWLYDIRNFGDLYLDKTVFGCNVGASSGAMLGESGGNEWADDAAKFYRQFGLAVNYDADNIGVRGYTPVPWVGFAFLESPGNPYDGIDNDGDANDPTKPGGATGKIISEIDDFVKFYDVGDNIILINYESENFDRTISQMPAGGITVTHNGATLILKPNAPLIEQPRNGLDDNLNGLIDEADGTVTQDSLEFYLYVRSEYNQKDYLSFNYFTGEGIENLLIDERRDDELDNDGDWDSQFDDVGIDGKPATGDTGEGDGLPTPGTSELPGEPNVDQVDVDESDQIGLTSFKFYRYSTLTYSNDDQMWEFSRPGYFDNTTTEIADHDYVFSSGYFPLRPGQKEFFSVAMVYGWDEVDILRNKDVVQKIYDSNYNFAIAPLKPKLKAVAGDRTVTLYWDDNAEGSFDRFLKEYDFEGYKIYKASHYTFGDAGSITDGLGYERFKKPIAIYDKIDGIYGYFPNDFGAGVLFNMGSESGLVHSYVDRDVTNGIKYYYAVTAFDRGNLSKNIGPTETTIFLNVDQSGNIQFAENVVAVTPQAPSLGYEEPKFDIEPKLAGSGITSGVVGVNILNPDSLESNDDYEIQFLDQSMDKIDNDFNGLTDQADRNELLPIVTTGFVLKNVTKNVTYDTVWFKEYRLTGTGYELVKNLFDDNDGDPNTLTSVVSNMEIYMKNPEPGVVDRPEEEIYEGIKWGGDIDPFNTYDLNFGRFTLGGFQPGTPYPRQYEIIFYNEIVDTSTKIGVPLAATGKPIMLPSSPVNFKVYDKQSGRQVDVGFVDQSVDKQLTPKGFFSAKDYIVFFEKLSNDSTLITFSLGNNADEDTTFYKTYDRLMGAGDTLSLYPDLPFNSETKFVYRLQGQKVNKETAKNELSRIKVVPNPYVVTALWEPHNPYTSGRGPRAIQFINLPNRCTIRIFTVDGTLVQTLDHDSNIRDGSETWNLMTKDNMEVAYGIYIYHVDAPGIGEHVGRLLIIK
ncbi:MAG: hypothetical protein AB1521_02785 [Bacteroidota bacterium]